MCRLELSFLKEKWSKKKGWFRPANLIKWINYKYFTFCKFAI